MQKLCTRSKAQQQCRNQVSMHEFSGIVTVNVTLDYFFLHKGGHQRRAPCHPSCFIFVVLAVLLSSY